MRLGRETRVNKLLLFKENNLINTLPKRDSLNHFSGETDHSVPAHPGLCLSQGWWNYSVEADWNLWSSGTTAASASRMRAGTPRLIFSEA